MKGKTLTQTNDEQMLLNLLRMKYRDNIAFLEMELYCCGAALLESCAVGELCCWGLRCYKLPVEGGNSHGVWGWPQLNGGANSKVMFPTGREPLQT